jgi:Protein of unknown function (DUF2852)
MGSCSQGWSREERRAWKQEQRANWQARKDEWRQAGHGGWNWRPAYGWTPLNIAAMVIGFVIFFPIGLGILAWNIWSSRQLRQQPAHAGMGAAYHWAQAPWSQVHRDLARNSGNAVFEDYKRATLERLEEERRKLVAEQEAFASFLDDLKRAKDRTEFEHFMQEREARREQESARSDSPATPTAKPAPDQPAA